MNDRPMETIRIRAFKAIDEPATCAEFLRQHRKVLEDFGIEHVNTNNAEWATDPDTYLVIASSDEYGMIGGLRLEVSKEGRVLPIVDALQGLDGRIQHAVDRWSEEGCAEICGLWNANKYVNRGLPTLLGYAAVAIAHNIGVKSLVCLIAHYTLRHALRVGFTIMEDVGNEGTFSYPIPSIKAIALVMQNTLLLNNAQDQHRLPVISLRVRPHQQRVEQPTTEPVLVDYDLRLDSRLVDLSLYADLQEARLRYTG